MGYLCGRVPQSFIYENYLYLCQYPIFFFTIYYVLEILIRHLICTLVHRQNPWRGSRFIFLLGTNLRRIFVERSVITPLIVQLRTLPFFTTVWRRTVTLGTRETRGHYREPSSLSSGSL